MPPIPPIPPMPPMPAALQRGGRSAVTLFGLVGDHGVGRQQQAGHAGRVLQRRAHDLGRVRIRRP